jgi:PAS domain S-box-containing protein
METSPNIVQELTTKLQSSEKLLASVFDAVAVGIAVLDENGNFVKVNQEYCRIYGYTNEELIGKHFTITVLEHQHDFAINSHKKFLETGGRMTMEATVVTKTGELIDIYLQATLLVQDDGQRFKVMSVTDITAKKAQDNNLVAFQKQYKLLVDNLHDVIYTTDDALKLTFITPSVFRMYGYTEDEFMQLAISEYLMPDSINVAMKSHLQRLDFEAKNPNLTKPYVVIAELEAKRKDGTTFWIEVVSTRLYDEQNQKIGFVATIRDITLRRQQEIELKKLSLVASKTENVIIITTNDGKIEWVNDAFVKVTGYSFEESIGRNPNFLQGQETSMKDVLAISEGLKSKKPFIQEILNYTKNGEKYWVELNITPIFKVNGEIDKYFAVESDVTRRKETEKQLREYAEKQFQLTEDLTNQNNDLRQFSYILSHNIRSYVANILGIIHVMDLAPMDKDEQYLYLKMLNQAAIGLDTVIKDLNDILDIRRPFNKQIERLLLPKIITEATNILKSQIEECHAVIIYELEITEVYGVKPYLQSIFYNLISNAIKYRTYHKILEIVISSKIIDNKIIITVKDNGLGIDLLAQKDNIFTLYKRFHTHTAGKGLGLFMVKTQVEAMGGKISVESAINQGSIFTIALPHIISQS